MFLERALPVQATNMGRRIGADWLYTGIPNWLFDLATSTAAISMATTRATAPPRTSSGIRSITSRARDRARRPM